MCSQPRSRSDSHTVLLVDTPGALPPHSILAQQRSDAMEALLKIEIAFARLRDKFHVERMEQCLKEERQLLDGVSFFYPFLKPLGAPWMCTDPIGYLSD